MPLVCRTIIDWHILLQYLATSQSYNAYPYPHWFAADRWCKLQLIGNFSFLCRALEESFYPSTRMVQLNQVDLNSFITYFNAFSADRLSLLIKSVIIIISTSWRIFSKTPVTLLSNWVNWKPSSVNILMTLINNLLVLESTITDFRESFA